MSIDDGALPGEPDGPPPDVPAARGKLEQFRARREELQAERHIDLPVPGYEDLGLHARVRPVPFEQLERIAGRTSKSKDPRRTINATADQIVAATEQLLILDGPDGEPVPFNEAFGLGPDPVRFDKRFADALGIPDAKTARDVLLATFPDDLAIAAFAVQITTWQRGDPDDEESLGADGQADKELLGES